MKSNGLLVSMNEDVKQVYENSFFVILLEKGKWNWQNYVEEQKKNNVNKLWDDSIFLF